MTPLPEQIEPSKTQSDIWSVPGVLTAPTNPADVASPSTRHSTQTDERQFESEVVPFRAATKPQKPAA